MRRSAENLFLYLKEVGSRLKEVGSRRESQAWGGGEDGEDRDDVAEADRGEGGQGEVERVEVVRDLRVDVLLGDEDEPARDEEEREYAGGGARDLESLGA